MPEFKTDLHNHTVLSPCGDLEMSPSNLIKTAKRKGIEILGITDHNTTKHCRICEKLGKKEGLFILKGAEITTIEEIHCLAFFENNKEIDELEKLIQDKISRVKNVPEKSGYQVVVDESDIIIEEIDYSLISAINMSIDELEKWVHERNGIFIPAHIDRTYYSLISQLGFIPPDIKAEGFELSKNSSVNEITSKFPYMEEKTFIRNSDAHFIDSVATNSSIYNIKEKKFEEVRKALNKEDNREVIIKKIVFILKDLALHILDISENSVRAGAKKIEISITESSYDDSIVFSVRDNGSGMSEEMVKSVTDPYFTSRNTRKVGMGIPLLKHNAESTGGELKIVSEKGKGTQTTAKFTLSHIDMIPSGDIAGTLIILLTSYSEINFVYTHKAEEKEFTTSSNELKEALEVEDLNTKEIKKIIKEYLVTNIKDLNSKF